MSWISKKNLQDYTDGLKTKIDSLGIFGRVAVDGQAYVAEGNTDILPFIPGTNVDISITNNGIEFTSPYTLTGWIGTTTAWNALSSTDKAKYKVAILDNTVNTYDSTTGTLTPTAGGSIQLDNVPTANSNNAAKSGGIYTAIEGTKGQLGKEVTATISGNTVSFTDALIGQSTSVIDWVYVENNLFMTVSNMVISGNTMTVTFTDSSADTMSAKIWIRTVA